MRRRLTHDTGYWERGGATAFGKVAAASRLWLADAIVSNQTGPRRAQARQGLSWEPDRGRQHVTTAFGWEGEAAGVQGTKGEQASNIESGSLSPGKPQSFRCSSTGTLESLPPSFSN